MPSAAIDSYLAAEGHGETADSLLAKPPIKPPVQFDGSQPLTHYFISSSHNTYLLGNQLWGGASPKAYTTALEGLEALSPARCVEIDVWYTSKGPVVTHGHTFTGSIPFQGVCQAISDSVKPTDLPVWISLECHVEEAKQPELVQIMKRTWGSKLVDKKIEELEGKKVAPDDLRGRIVMMVEWYPPPGNENNTVIKLNAEDSASSSSEESDSENEEVKAMREWRRTHKGGKLKMNEALAELGVYANSIKPTEGWLERELLQPLHALINISESQVLKLLKVPKSKDLLAYHAQHHLRRCYPKGLRVDSDNMDPMPIWRCGTHVVGINFQHWDRGTQLNGALFRDTPGYILKPESLRGGPARTGQTTLKFTVLGGDDIPHAELTSSEPVSDQAIWEGSTYVMVKLYTHEKTSEWRTKTVKEHGGDPFWNENVRWTYKNDDLLFLKASLRRDKWGKDVEIASYSADLDRVEEGLRFWPLFNNKGVENIGRLLVKAEFS